MNILVLGHNGMLGHVVYKYLTNCGHNVSVSISRFPSDDFKKCVVNYDGDAIINCIGAIPQKTSEFNINYELPIWLDANAPVKVLHAGTDCESDTTEYGISKRNASDWLKENGKQTKIIKTSIIGPELSSKRSLFEWFLNSNNEVDGHNNAMWNGITTLEWAKWCEKMINDWQQFPMENVFYTDCISKYELLNIIKTVFLKQITVNKNEQTGKNKCLNNGIYTGPIRSQLEQLKQYYYGD